ncbi:MAG: hypothetical protein JXB07_06740 [Anaerolineae bacterium]|nr:hypothetical protein [Anaerolineae bacterium]
MKKKKLTRKERKQLRDEELSRRGIDPEARRPPQKQLSGKAIWASLFQSGQQDKVQEAFAMALVTSDELVDEPEFEEIVLDPMESVEALVEVAEKRGLSPGVDSYSEDVQMDVLDGVIRKVLTKPLQKQIKDAIDRLVDRLEETGDKDTLVQASAVQSFLKMIKEKSAWTGIGLVREFVRQSLEEGFDIIQVSDEKMPIEKLLGDIIQLMDDDEL